MRAGEPESLCRQEPRRSEKPVCRQGHSLLCQSLRDQKSLRCQEPLRCEIGALRSQVTDAP